jgi:hypothetical protein
LIKLSPLISRSGPIKALGCSDPATPFICFRHSSLETKDVGAKVAWYQASIHVLIGRSDGGHWALVSVEIPAEGSDRSDPRSEESILEAAYKHRCNHYLTIGLKIAT